MTPNPRIVIVISLVVLALNFAYLPFVSSDHKIYPFPYNPKQYVNVTNHVDFIFGRMGTILLFVGLIFYYVPALRAYTFWAGILWLMWFFDYFMTYNDPYKYYGWIPESWSLWMAVILFAWLGHDFSIKQRD